MNQPSNDDLLGFCLDFCQKSPVSASKRSFSSPSQLARSLGLKRAAAKASNWKSSHSEVFKSLQISSLNHVDVVDYQFEKVNEILENYYRETESKWDQDFSSMSSCQIELADAIVCSDHSEEIQAYMMPDTESSSHSNSNSWESLWLADDLEPEKENIPNRDRAIRRMRNRESLTSLPHGLSSAVADSFALMKHSFDPYTDFKESITEMIQENELSKWSELEELLFSYLSLNSPEQHGVIKDAFVEVLASMMRTNNRTDFEEFM